jgi:hypothetical protein
LHHLADVFADDVEFEVDDCSFCDVAESEALRTRLKQYREVSKWLKRPGAL